MVYLPIEQAAIGPSEEALRDRGYITGQTIAAQTKNLKGDISLAALDAPL
jgi:hypothetical protein